jgi:hypothetical protein
MKTSSHKYIAVISSIFTIGSTFAIPSLSTNYVTNPTIYIAGSTAFSPLDNAALDNYATNNGYTLSASTGSADPKKAKAVVYRKSTYATNNISRKVTVTVDTINVHQTGSEAGIYAAAGGKTNLTVGFLPDTNTGLNQADSAAAYSNSNPVAIITSPVWQASSRFAPRAKINGVTYSALTEVFGTNNSVGIAAQVWGWSASPNFPSTAANITSQVAKKLLKDGSAPLSFFTGNQADSTNGVWLVGRDIYAGARIAVLGEVGYGTLNDVRQFRVNTNGGSVTLSLESAVVAGTDGISIAAGNGGYASASSQLVAAKTTLPVNLQVNLGSGLTNSPYTGTNYLIQYNDYKSVVGQTNSDGTPALVTLAFNGVPPTTNGVITGSYSLWTYEHLYIAPKPKNTNTINVANYIANYITGLNSEQLKSAAGASGYLNINDLKVTRSSDGGLIRSIIQNKN